MRRSLMTSFIIAFATFFGFMFAIQNTAFCDEKVYMTIEYDENGKKRVVYHSNPPKIEIDKDGNKKVIYGPDVFEPFLTKEAAESRKKNNDKNVKQISEDRKNKKNSNRRNGRTSIAKKIKGNDKKVKHLNENEKIKHYKDSSLASSIVKEYDGYKENIDGDTPSNNMENYLKQIDNMYKGENGASSVTDSQPDVSIGGSSLQAGERYGGNRRQTYGNAQESNIVTGAVAGESVGSAALQASNTATVGQKNASMSDIDSNHKSDLFKSSMGDIGVTYKREVEMEAQRQAEEAKRLAAKARREAEEAKMLAELEAKKEAAEEARRIAETNARREAEIAMRDADESYRGSNNSESGIGELFGSILEVGNFALDIRNQKRAARAARHLAERKDAARIARENMRIAEENRRRQDEADRAQAEYDKMLRDYNDDLAKKAEEYRRQREEDERIADENRRRQAEAIRKRNAQIKEYLAKKKAAEADARRRANTLEPYRNRGVDLSGFQHGGRWDAYWNGQTGSDIHADQLHDYSKYKRLSDKDYKYWKDHPEEAARRRSEDDYYGGGYDDGLDVAQ